MHTPAFHYLLCVRNDRLLSPCHITLGPPLKAFFEMQFFIETLRESDAPAHVLSAVFEKDQQKDFHETRILSWQTHGSYKQPRYNYTCMSSWECTMRNPCVWSECCCKLQGFYKGGSAICSNLHYSRKKESWHVSCSVAQITPGSPDGWPYRDAWEHLCYDSPLAEFCIPAAK